ncbi:MAG TPA: tRNA preQ1(34) S-adenosylmethionine ribosyltransferase-isomerase QueA [Thermoanaerobaculia bacterium]|nr:tRNA preQ1(34) S-adenosylmethionine ribosyltransferase-isomerase QueA [Thermoanaerobaculia bacterium]
MLTADFDFELPEEAIAQRPVARGEARLLVLDRPGADRHRRVHELPSLLRRGDLLVVNDTRVIPARLHGRRRPGGGGVEILLVERVGEREWDVLARPGRKARPGTVLDFGTGADGEPVSGEMIGREEDGGATSDDHGDGDGDGRRRIRFAHPIEPHLEHLGHVPLPPYIKRADEAADRATYQTVYARSPGAIAAPTAGLHLSQELLSALAEAGAEIVAITLHVGIGTFKPVTAPLVHEHRMERERYEIPTETAAAIRRVRHEGGRVVAVGTTVTRALEAAALEAEALAAEAAGTELGEVVAGRGTTELFITPGYRFRVVDVLLTNFHLPRSTLLMLVSAFAGRERVLAAYREAVAAGYRFYSYGDAMLAERAEP